MVLVGALVSMGGLASLAPALAHRLGRDAGYVLAVGYTAVAIWLGFGFRAVLTGSTITESWSWIPALGVSFTLRLDGLTALFCLLVLGVGALIMAYCPRYLPVDGRHGAVYCLLTLFGAAMLGLVLAGDLVLLLVFWELTTIISFRLIGASGAKASTPAVRALLVTAIGGLALLAAVVLIAVAVGSTDLTTVLAARQQVLDSPQAPAVAALLIVAAFTKSAQLPFSFWLPGAMVAITPVSAYLHAATMVKAGIYLLLRFSTLFGDDPGWSGTLLAVGLATALLGAVRALREHDLKALLAYSTVSQLGLLVAAIGVGTTVALAAAILHTFAHALFKATLFMLVGIIEAEAGSRDIRDLSGLMRVMPVTATLTGLAGLSLAGVAPMIGFVSKESLFQGFTTAAAFPAAGLVAGALAVAASALTFAYGVRIFYGAFAGPALQRRLFEPSWAFLAPAAVAAVAGAVLGPAVAVLNPLMNRAITDIEPWAQPTRLALWHGFSPELLMSAVTLVFGMALFLAREPVDRLLQRMRPARGATLFDRGYEVSLRFGTLVGRPDKASSTWTYLVRPLLVLALLAGVGLASSDLAWSRTGWRSAPADWAILALLIMAVAGVTSTRTTLGAVASLGTVGLIVTTWFLLAGAPDVALTLLLVEVLTAMVAAFVLRGLPPRFPRAGRRGTLGAAGAAVLTGLAAVAATATLTGHRGLSAAGSYFLQAAESQAGGRNVVNTILVDFRSLDTLGEASVLAAAAMGLLLLTSRTTDRPDERPAPYATTLGPGFRLLASIIAILATYLFLRGHDEPGGGFIAALVAGTAIALRSLAGHLSSAEPHWPHTERPLSVGLMLMTMVGVVATVLGMQFLTPLKATLHTPAGELGLSSSLLFDLGVFAVVFGLMAAAVDRLGEKGGYR